VPNSITYNLLEACREPGCPVCRLEQQSVERYLDSHFYESVNSPAWRERLRLSLGFCHEHAWLGVNQRLGDALGFAILYHDVVSTVLSRLNEDAKPGGSSRRWTSRLRQIPEQARLVAEKMLSALTARKRCPVCEARDETTAMLLSTLVEALAAAEMTEALRASDGLCLPHLQQAFERSRDRAVCEQLFAIQREKLDRLQEELAEFIRKNDYQQIGTGFGDEGDAWLRAIAMVTGSRKKA
jgi:hypothetical protein